jgi:CheY-like chemotaxis protein
LFYGRSSGLRHYFSLTAKTHEGRAATDRAISRCGGQSFASSSSHCTAEPPRRAEAVNATPPAPLHWPIALIVEDELLIRCDLADCLRDAGWMVMETPNADQAMALCKDGIVVHVLITDIQLDGCANGWDVAEAFRASSSDVAVIYTTGNNHDRKRRVPNSLHFTKPYQPTEVLRACQELVARGGW